MPSLQTMGGASARAYGWGLSAGGGPVTLRSYVTQAGTSSASTITINKPAGVQQGDFMIAIFYDYNNETYSLGGWTSLGSVTPAAATTVLYKIAGASEPSSYAFSSSGSVSTYCGAYIAAYKNVTVGIDVNGTLTSSSSSITIPSITPTKVGRLLIVGGAYSTTGTWTCSLAGTTQQIAANPVSPYTNITLFDMASTTSATGSFTLSTGAGSYTSGLALNIY